MRTFLLLLVVTGLTQSTPLVRADDTISPELLQEMKNATVYIKCRCEDGSGSTGSGFVISTAGDAHYVATNYHVIQAQREDAVRRPGAAVLQIPIIHVVFRSGARDEQTVVARIVAADPTRDLAILGVAGVNNPPTPVDYENTPKLIETTTVYIFGFPYGQRLAGNAGNPGVTINKAAISKFVTYGEQVQWVQINGDLNPGNSGGPIVDGQGHLVGISTKVALDPRTHEMTRIGFAVPHGAVAGLVRSAKLPPPVHEPSSTVIVSTIPNNSGKRKLQPQLSLDELNQVVTDLRSTNEFHRCRAAKLLANVKPTDAARLGVSLALAPLLTDADTFTRKVGAEALGTWGGKDHVPHLIKLVEDKEAKVRAAAMDALSRLADPRGIEVVLARLAIGADRVAARQALQQFGTACEKAVLPFLDHETPAVRLEVCAILKEIGTPLSREALEKAAAVADQEVAQAAKDALQTLSGRSK